MSKVRVTVPATSANLGPGYNSMALALSLHNVIELSLIDEGLSFDLSGESTGDLPRSPSNLIVRGAAAVFRKTGCAPSGLHVSLESGIPAGCGLGSSAAAILGGVVAANVLVGSPLAREELLRIAVEVEGHPEAVSAALFGGLVASSLSQEEFVYSTVPIAPMRVVVALPVMDGPTPDAVLPQGVSLSDAAANIGRASLVLLALSRGDFALLERAMDDRLHEPFRRRGIPAYKWAKAAALRHGASAVAISGAGPALIAFSASNHEEIANMMARAFREGADLETRTWILPVDTQGISISEIGVSLPRGGRPIPASPRNGASANGQQPAAEPDATSG